jgi:hypothetical protein
MSKRFLRTGKVVGVLAGSTTAASACGLCFAGEMDVILPPIELWVFLAITWFVSNGITRSATGISIPGQPGALGVVLIVAAVLLLGAAAFGPIMVFPLFVPSVLGFARSFRPSPGSVGSRGVRTIQIAGWVHVVGVLCATTLLVHSHLYPKPELYICKWRIGPQVSKLFRELRATEPSSLPAYRYVMQHASWGPSAVKATERIGEIGEPGDIVLLRRTLSRFSENENPIAFSTISTAVGRLQFRQKNTQPIVE